MRKMTFCRRSSKYVPHALHRTLSERCTAQVKEQQALIFAMLEKMTAGAPSSKPAAPSSRRLSVSSVKGGSSDATALLVGAVLKTTSQHMPDRKAVPVENSKGGSNSKRDGNSVGVGDVELQDL
jgi:hypothetical protein